MAQTLPSDSAEERLRWIKSYLERKSSLTQIAELSPFSYRTLKRWVRSYRKSGEAGLVPKSRRPHRHPRRYTNQIVRRVRQLRTGTGLGPDVLAILLRREGIGVSPSGLSKLLKREGLTHKRIRLAPKERWVRKADFSGDLVEIDVAYVRKFKGSWLFQFSAVDGCTRWRYSWVTSQQSNHTAVLFLRRLVANSPFRIRAVKTDNATIFTNRYVGYPKSTDPLRPRLHIFDQVCNELCIAHYLISPGKPQQNGKVERSHRTDRERFWSRVRFRTVRELAGKHARYLDWANEVCPHLGLQGLTPREKLEEYQGTNVRV